MNSWLDKQWALPWRRRGVMWGAGALAALALPPFFLFPLLVPSLMLFQRGVRSAGSWKAAFAAGWWWSWGFFVVGLYWICHSLLVDVAAFGWLIPFALLGLPGGLAIFGALAAVAAYVAGGGVVALSMCWVLAEWVRGFILTGFAWNQLGYALNIAVPLMQGAAVWGIYGSSLVVMLLALVAGRSWKGALASVLAVGLLYGAGEWRLRHPPAMTAEGPVLRVVQANVEQKLKWQPEERGKAVWTHVGLSRHEAAVMPKMVIWSETSVPFVMGEDPALNEALAQAVPPGGMLMTGAMRVEGEGIYNSLFAVNERGEVAGTYDKRHLVPFGEFVPLRKYVPLVSMVYGGGDFSHGQGPAVMEVGGLPAFRPLICYEAIFPEEVQVPGDKRPQWLLNITNDAWFGFSTGPYQHLEAARLRAVEQGMPLVRAANTGMSAVVDAFGRVVSRLPLEEQGVMDAVLPAAMEEATFYGKFNKIIPIVVGLYCAVALLLHRKTGFIH